MLTELIVSLSLHHLELNERNGYLCFEPRAPWGYVWGCIARKHGRCHNKSRENVSVTYKCHWAFPNCWPLRKHCYLPYLGCTLCCYHSSLAVFPFFAALILAANANWRIPKTGWIHLPGQSMTVRFESWSHGFSIASTWQRPLFLWKFTKCTIHRFQLATTEQGVVCL